MNINKKNFIANDLALRPIERLIDKVNKIAKNPISAKEQKLV